MERKSPILLSQYRKNELFHSAQKIALRILGAPIIFSSYVLVTINKYNLI